VDPSAPARSDGSPERFTAAAHAAACSLHAVFVDPHDIKPVYVCSNPEEAKHDRGLRVYTTPLNPPAPNGTVAPLEPTADQIQAAEEAERIVQQRHAEAQRAEAERREGLEVAGRLRGAFLASTVQRSGRAGTTPTWRTSRSWRA
jgi:hypothetical protein